ncbi:putative endophilin-A isoform X1 [Sesbania bispinosa]|nr:putative endophilin-A isoform X1 [Sesbania bispinosa]
MKGNLQVQPAHEMEPKQQAETEMDNYRRRRLTAVRWAFLTARRRAATVTGGATGVPHSGGTS